MKRRNFFRALGTGAFFTSSMAMLKSATAKTGKIDQHLTELGITLPQAPGPVAAYTPFRLTGNLVYIAG